MLIRAEQMEALELSAKQQFEDEMVDHSKDFSPRLSNLLGDDQLRVAVRAAIEKSQTYNFTYRGPIRLYVELMFLCGSAFDTDPQYSSLGAALRSSEPQMQRAQLIHEGHNDYLEKVSGPDAVNVKTALRNLLAVATAPMLFSNDFNAGMAQEIHGVFPQKAAYVGEAGLNQLIDEANAEAVLHGFNAPRHRALLIILKFCFWARVYG